MEITTVGQEYRHPFSFSQEQVELFARVTGDINPIHLDEEYARTTPFKTRILHGFLGGSIFSTVFGTIVPGKGTIYLSQSMKFLKPMFPGRAYVAQLVVREIVGNRARIETIILDSATGEPVLVGEALVLNRTAIRQES